MNNVIGKTRDGREIRERQDYSQPGHCAECGQHVNPYDPELWKNLSETGLEERVDERGLKDDERVTPEQARQRIDWDGSCIYCGAPADRVGRVESNG